MTALTRLTTLHEISLADLWREAETLGNVDVMSMGTGWHDDQPRTGYRVKLTGKRRNSTIKVTRDHPVLTCALADAINEAREMGLGEPT